MAGNELGSSLLFTGLSITFKKADHHVRRLAFILGIIALIGTCWVSVSFVRATRGEHKALAEGAKAKGLRSQYQIIEELKLETDDARVNSDETELHNDGIRIDIANLENKGLLEAQKRQRNDEAALQSAENLRDLDESSVRIFGDPRINAATDRLEACERSYVTWRSAIARDEKIAIALVVLWIAFGFALALQGGRPSAAVA